MAQLPPMTRDELLELAPLDALGLLDEYDALLFSRGFHAAPEHVRTEVLELQASVAGDEDLLPDVLPPEGMRRRVIAAVRQEADEAVDLAPLATIGRPRPVAAAGASLDRGGIRPAASAATRPHRRFIDSLASQGWRAAAFALTASMVVAIFFGSQILDRNRELHSLLVQMAAEQSTAGALNGLDAGVGDSWLLQARNPGTTRVPLVATRGRALSGMVYVDPTSGNGTIVVHGLPADDGRFRLVITAEDGELLAQTDLGISPAVAAASFEIKDITLLASARIEVVSADGSAWLQMA